MPTRIPVEVTGLLSERVCVRKHLGVYSFSGVGVSDVRSGHGGYLPPPQEGLGQFLCALEMRDEPVASLSLSGRMKRAMRSAHISMGRKRQMLRAD